MPSQRNKPWSGERNLAGCPMPTEQLEDIFTLPEGRVLLQYPSTMSPDSFVDFSAWLELVRRKIARMAEPGENVR